MRDRIWELEYQVKLLNMLPKVSCYGIGDALPEDSIINLLAIDMNAIKKHLGIRVVYRLVDDERYIAPEAPKRKEWYAEKIKSQKPKN